MVSVYLLDKKIFGVGADAAYSAVVEFIRSLPVPISQEDSDRRIIVVGYPHKVVHMIFWYCWANAIEIRFRRIGEDSVVVEFRSRPNLFKLRPPKRVLEPRDFIERISVHLRQQEGKT